MRLFLLLTLTMIAFAANSVTNRMAVSVAEIGAIDFVLLRVGFGALFLGVLISAREGMHTLLQATDHWAPLGLTLYLLGFSLAYVTLDAGLGALILFGGVQLTMFGGALILGRRPGLWQWVGSGLGLLGLSSLFLPQGGAVIDPAGAIFMGVAAFGWGLYSLRGQRATAPLITAGQSFLLSAPVILMLWVLAGEGRFTAPGVVLAVLSGVGFSGLGYVLWFYVLPRIATTTAAVAQLTVPLIAMLGGILFLGESLTLGFIAAAVMVLGGVCLSVLTGKT